MAENKGFGTPGYLNPNCWLVSNSKTQAFQRCRYCRLRWRNCLSFQFLIVTLIALAALGVLALFQVPPFTGIFLTEVQTKSQRLRTNSNRRSPSSNKKFPKNKKYLKIREMEFLFLTSQEKLSK